MNKRYAFCFDYKKSWMIMLYDGVGMYADKSFNNEESYFDDSYEYMKMYLGDEGKFYHYKIDTYDTLMELTKDYDLFELENKPIEKLDKFLV